MSKDYRSYLRDFRSYAALELGEATAFIQIGTFATLLTNKANELHKRASFNARINTMALQTEMFEMGGVYVKEFSRKFKVAKFIILLVLLQQGNLFRY